MPEGDARTGCSLHFLALEGLYRSTPLMMPSCCINTTATVTMMCYGSKPSAGWAGLEEAILTTHLNG